MSKQRLDRLLRPATIAVFGGQWAEAVIEQCRRSGFAGDIWPVHPSRNELAGEPCFKSIDQLPGVPDACFIAVNNETTVGLVRSLSESGAGGAVCFAAGFSETAELDADAEARQHRLVEAAGDMPFIGPNCYGLVNYLDKMALWPDQHGGRTVESGVAIITQSSNIAINLSMQQRGLSLAYLLTAGNQAQTSIAELAMAMIEDDRVTALGLHIEGFSDVRAFEQLALMAQRMGKRVVVLKTGITSLARAALMSHTRSLSGDDTASSAFIERMGMCRVSGLGEFIETLKVLNLPSKVRGSRVLSMSCSGGEAALVSDMGLSAGLNFPTLTERQVSDLRVVLGPALRLANPLDYHTAIWDDDKAMRDMVAGMLQTVPRSESEQQSANEPNARLADISLIVLDFPRSDRCDAPSWHSALESYIAAAEDWPGLIAVLATLPENMPEELVERLQKKGVVALCGLGDGLRALRNAAWLESVGHYKPSQPVWLDEKPDADFKRAALTMVDGTGRPVERRGARRASQEAWGLVQAAAPDAKVPRVLDECTAKRWLNRFGVPVPVNVRLSFADVRSSRRLSRALDKASSAFTYPVVAKGLGIVHKSEANAIELGIDNRRELERAILRIDCEGGCLIEEYVKGAVAELLVGVIRDPVHGLLMTLAAGGVTTEILNDSVHCLLPVTREEVDRRLLQLRCAPLLAGFRSRPVVDRELMLDAIMSVQQAALQLGERLVELEINPLLCTAQGCTAVDAFVAVRDLPGTSPA